MNRATIVVDMDDLAKNVNLLLLSISENNYNESLINLFKLSRFLDNNIVEIKKEEIKQEIVEKWFDDKILEIEKKHE